MKKIFYTAIVSVLFLSCKTINPNFEYTPLDKFDYDAANISKGAKIKILSYSGGPSCTSKITYLYQFIGINTETNDTVRILSPCTKLPDGNNPTEGSFSPWEETLAIINKALAEHEQSGFESEEKIIVFNKLNSAIEKGNYKTAIGSLGF